MELIILLAFVVRTLAASSITTSFAATLGTVGDNTTSEDRKSTIPSTATSSIYLVLQPPMPSERGEEPVSKQHDKHDYSNSVLATGKGFDDHIPGHLSLFVDSLGQEINGHNTDSKESKSSVPELQRQDGVRQVSDRLSGGSFASQLTNRPVLGQTVSANRVIESNTRAAVAMVESFVDDMVSRPSGNRPGYVMINSPNPVIIQQLVAALTRRYGSSSVTQDQRFQQRIIANGHNPQILHTTPRPPQSTSPYMPIFPHESHWQAIEATPAASEVDYIIKQLSSIADVTISSGMLINDTLAGPSGKHTDHMIHEAAKSQVSAAGVDRIVNENHSINDTGYKSDASFPEYNNKDYSNENTSTKNDTGQDLSNSHNSEATVLKEEEIVTLISYHDTPPQVSHQENKTDGLWEGGHLVEGVPEDNNCSGRWVNASTALNPLGVETDYIFQHMGYALPNLQNGSDFVSSPVRSNAIHENKTDDYIKDSEYVDSLLPHSVSTPLPSLFSEKENTSTTISLSKFTDHETAGSETTIIPLSTTAFSISESYKSDNIIKPSITVTASLHPEPNDNEVVDDSDTRRGYSEDYYEEIDGEMVLSSTQFMRRTGPLSDLDYGAYDYDDEALESHGEEHEPSKNHVYDIEPMYMPVVKNKPMKVNMKNNVSIGIKVDKEKETLRAGTHHKSSDNDGGIVNDDRDSNTEDDDTGETDTPIQSDGQAGKDSDGDEGQSGGEDEKSDAAPPAHYHSLSYYRQSDPALYRLPPLPPHLFLSRLPPTTTPRLTASVSQYRQSVPAHYGLPPLPPNFFPTRPPPTATVRPTPPISQLSHEQEELISRLPAGTQQVVSTIVQALQAAPSSTPTPLTSHSVPAGSSSVPVAFHSPNFPPSVPAGSNSVPAASHSLHFPPSIFSSPYPALPYPIFTPYPYYPPPSHQYPPYVHQAADRQETPLPSLTHFSTHHGITQNLHSHSQGAHDNDGHSHSAHDTDPHSHGSFDSNTHSHRAHDSNAHSHGAHDSNTHSHGAHDSNAHSHGAHDNNAHSHGAHDSNAHSHGAFDSNTHSHGAHNSDTHIHGTTNNHVHGHDTHNNRINSHGTHEQGQYASSYHIPSPVVQVGVTVSERTVTHSPVPTPTPAVALLSAAATLDPDVGLSRLGEVAGPGDVHETGVRDNVNQQGSLAPGPRPDRNQGILHLRQDPPQMGHGHPTPPRLVQYRPPQQAAMHMGGPVVNVVVPQAGQDPSPLQAEDEGSLIDLVDNEETQVQPAGTPSVDREEMNSLLQSLFSSPTLLLLGIVFATSAAYMAITMEEQAAQQRFQQAQLAAAFAGQPFPQPGRRRRSAVVSRLPLSTLPSLVPAPTLPLLSLHHPPWNHL